MFNGYQPNNFTSAFQSPQSVIRVNGIEGAKAYSLPPNSSVLLLDETSPVVYLKMTDGASYPTITPYTISPIEPKKEVNYDSLESRISRLEEMLNGDKSNNRNAKQHKQNDGSNKSD